MSLHIGVLSRRPCGGGSSSLESQLHQPVGGILRAIGVVEHIANIVVFDHVGQAVAAEQQPIAVAQGTIMTEMRGIALAV